MPEQKRPHLYPPRGIELSAVYVVGVSWGRSGLSLGIVGLPGRPYRERTPSVSEVEDALGEGPAYLHILNAHEGQVHLLFDTRQSKAHAKRAE
eukprot:7676601-Pyramimonas_sp.AAC.1